MEKKRSKISKNALSVLERRYLTKDENGRVVETPDEMFLRVAKAVAEAEKNFGATEEEIARAAELYYQMMSELDFMPNSPTLMNAGKPLGQLSACFVLPVEDSMVGIFDSIKNAALIHKSGGGTGFSFTRLRQSGATVRTTGGVASGPISFMRVFNSATDAVKQGGTRRGANMGILRIDHPDILEFIRCKTENADLTNFNISVGITEKFMRAVENGENYDLVDPRTKKKVSELNAREVFDTIVSAAWKNGEPGIVFLDRINRDNVVPELGEIEATNPCGEQPLLPYESCNLGSINLGNMVTSRGEINFGKLKRTVKNAVRFLDDVIDANNYPLPQISETTLSTRKIGLGVMGFADMLFKLGIAYNSDEGVKLGAKIMRFINDRAHEASAELAKTRGPFPAFHESTLKDGVPMRNATCTTIAPTGTISIICGASSGIEPLFALSFVRNVMDNDELPQVDPFFEETAKREGFYSTELMRRIANEGTVHNISEVPERIKQVFVTAHDISPEYHIKMQSAFQRHVDNAVSKTVNFPGSATKEEVAEVYMLAYKLGCKGVTIYRDGSRDAQVLTVGTKDSKQEAKTPAEPQANAVISPRERPSVTRGITEKVKIGCGNLYITVNYDDEGICEVFTNLGRAGGCPSQSEATSRLVSTALRSGLAVEELIAQLKGIRCHSTLRQKGSNPEIKVLSCPDAIGTVLEKVYKELQGRNLINQPEPESSMDNEPAEGHGCPECGKPLTHEGGCVICPYCGYSKCD